MAVNSGYNARPMNVVTRFPPSPTGNLHIGGARTALFNWLYARRHGGRFILRLEDTDRERSTEAAVEDILQGMAWLGLDWDEGPIRQSQRFDRYRAVIGRLLEAGQAYRCYCSRERLDAIREEAQQRGAKPRYDGHCRERSEPPPEGVDPVIRFRNPLDGNVVIDDAVRGKVSISNRELDDLIIARSDGTPTYHLTVVVDDIDMGVTHVIRGDDHLNNTPRQINILDALGAARPVYAHVPMILGADGKRLSKRHGALSVLEYRDQGVLPEALLNYLVRLGWSHGDQEIFSVAELIDKFDIGAVNKAAATFDPDKLAWLNQQYIKEAEPARLGALLAERLQALGVEPGAAPSAEDVAVALKERAKTLDEMAAASRYFFEDFAEYDAKAAQKNLTAEATLPLQALREGLGGLAEWRRGPIHDRVQQVAEHLDQKLGKVAQPLRVAATGGAVSPPIDVTLELIGRERTLARIDRALAYIAGDAPA
jgi:glutamyl-tRNA synthetase